MIDVNRFLTERGVIVDGKQARPVGREDLLAILDANDNVVDFLEFNGLDFSGADIRGLNLDRAYFSGCNFSKVIAFPLIKFRGNDLGPSDLARGWILDRWEHGTFKEMEQVIPTSFTGSFLSGSTLNDAQFQHTNFTGAFLDRIKADGTNLYRANLHKAFAGFAVFRDADLRYVNLVEANLVGVRLETTQLDGIDWGPKLTLIQELEGKYDEAIQVYRALTRSHQNAGDERLAGEFRYREAVCRRKARLAKVFTKSRRAKAQGRMRHWASALVHGGFPDLVSWMGSAFMDQLFGFGERPLRVVRAAALVVVVFALVYFDYGVLEWSRSGLIEFANRLGNGMYFSAVSFTALGYGSWANPPVGALRYIGAIQSFVGVFLMALFLVTFTRRLMR
ncbi:MAG: pentapeptide repeat-containing protein [Chloroflexi bacterium]|nr:pentapeptide repeat-containing protein [Chloroflexota bacterium]